MEEQNNVQMYERRNTESKEIKQVVNKRIVLNKRKEVNDETREEERSLVSMAFSLTLVKEKAMKT